MPKFGACTAFGLVPITFEFPLSAYHARNTLWLRYSSLLTGNISIILVVRTDRILRFQLRLPREIVEVAIVIVNRVEGHTRVGMERMRPQNLGQC